MSIQFFMQFLSIYFPLYPTGAIDTYTIAPSMTLFAVSFMFTSTMYILGASIASKYDFWAQGVTGIGLNPNTVPITAYESAFGSFSRATTLNWYGDVMFYLTVISRPAILTAYMIGVFAIPTISFEVLFYALFLGPW